MDRRKWVFEAPHLHWFLSLAVTGAKRCFFCGVEGMGRGKGKWAFEYEVGGGVGRA